MDSNATARRRTGLRRAAIGFVSFAVVSLLAALGYRHLYVDDPAPDFSDPLARPVNESPEARRAYEMLASFGDGVDARAGELAFELETVWRDGALADASQRLQARRADVETVWAMLAPDRERMARLSSLGEIAGLAWMEDAFTEASAYRTFAKGARLQALLLAADSKSDQAAALLEDPFRTSGRLLRSSREAFAGMTFVAGEILATDALKSIVGRGLLSADSLRALEKCLTDAEVDDLALADAWVVDDITYLHRHLVSISPAYDGTLGIPRLLPNATTRARLRFHDQQVELIQRGTPEAANALEEQPQSAEPGFFARNAAGRSDFMPGFTAFKAWDFLQRRRARLQELRDAIDMAQLTSHVAAD